MLVKSLRSFALLATAALMFTGAPTLTRAADVDPDLPAVAGSQIDKEAYIQAREDQIGMLRGLPFDPSLNPRLKAIQAMNQKARILNAFTSSGAWTPVGPYPIPNGQTTTSSSAVSGRTTCIAVDPTDANIVYVGTANGGVYRTLDGGANWTALFDGAASLAIGAVALAPSDHTILYVGTGEANNSADSFFGVGLYRIDNANTAPVLNGPFNPTPTTDVIGAKTFTGRSISKILVDPNDAATIFVSTNSGVGGLGADALGSSPPITALRGIYRSTNATSGSPAFAKLKVTASGSIPPDVTGNLIVNDMTYDPTDGTNNTIVCWVLGSTAVANGGIYRTTNALAATPVFTQQFTTTVANARGAFTANRVSGVTTMLVGTGETGAGTGCVVSGQSGCIRRSLDGGITWSAKLSGGGGYCGGQCFYDLPIAMHPNNASIVLIGGGGNSTCTRVYARSTDGAASFTAAGVADIGMHADAHAIAFAPSNPNIVYEANDGGIWRSTDAGATYTSMNTTGYSATQFQSIALHPMDANFSIGGTQDNGTNMYKPAATWNRIDFGDGGFAQIDQNAADNTNVTMYHTYFNQQNNLVGYAVVTGVANAFDGNWGFVGNNANGISVADAVNFYAPLVLGPGSPNTIYYGTNKLYRSSNGGTNHSVVSQTMAANVCAISVSKLNDNVRLIGLNNGSVFGTVTGSSTLTNMSPGIAKYVGRIGMDPNNANVAYVCYCGYGLAAGAHVWKTTNLLSGTPTWTASGNGIPDVPVNGCVVDPANSNQVFVGTDIGVFVTNDGGVNWLPFNTGLPVVPVFDMGIQNPNRILRIATHGRGMWERTIGSTTPVLANVIGTEIENGTVKLTWFVPQGMGRTVSIYRRPVPGDWAPLKDAVVNNQGNVELDDATAAAGRSYEYQLGLLTESGMHFSGQVWVDMPARVATLSLQRIAPNPASHGFNVTFALSGNAPATLELVDVSGRQVESQAVGSMGGGVHELAMGKGADIQNGVYFVRLQQAGRTFSKRVVIVR